jgi:hypothetical protein
MECLFSAENPDDIDFTMKITMKAKDWYVLKTQLDNSAVTALDVLNKNSPRRHLVNSISDLLSQARKTFYRDAPKDSSEPIKTMISEPIK